MRYVRLLVWIVVLAALAAGVWWWRVGRGPEVTAVSPTRGTAAEIVYATGAVEPVRWAKVASVIRERIMFLCNCEGKAVEQGFVLARLDDKEVRATIQELHAREDFAKRELARVTELMGRGVSTTQAYERASTDLRTVQALISLQQEKLNNYVISAPMDGVVLRQDGHVGEIAETGQILFRVGVLKPLRVEAEVNEEDVPRIAVGQRVLLRTDAFASRPLGGTLSDITPMGDPIAKTFRIYIALPEDTPLRIGMSLEVNIVTREKENALLVPSEAVIDNAVFVIDGDRIRRRPVTVGIRGTRQTEILSSLPEDARVVAVADSTLRDGQRVRVAREAARS